MYIETICLAIVHELVLISKYLFLELKTSLLSTLVVWLFETALIGKKRLQGIDSSGESQARGFTE